MRVPSRLQSFGKKILVCCERLNSSNQMIRGVLEAHSYEHASLPKVPSDAGADRQIGARLALRAEDWKAMHFRSHLAIGRHRAHNSIARISYERQSTGEVPDAAVAAQHW